MKDRCIPIEELPAVMRLAADDPRRVHMDHCPRCWARWLAYQDFQNPDALPPEARGQEAGEALAAALEAKILGSAQPAVEGPATNPRRIDSLLRRALALLLQPTLRPAWAVLAVALLVVAIQQTRPPTSGRGDAVTLRGEDVTAGSVLKATVESVGPEQILVSWHPMMDADRYEVALYGRDLVETRRQSTGQKTSLLVRTVDEAPASDSQTSRYLRVFAFQGQEELARSALTPIKPSQ